MAEPNDPGPRLLRILGIGGSLRRDSLNKKLLRAAVDLVPAGMTVDIFDRLGDIPPYNDDIQQVGKPEPVVSLVEAVREADGLLIVTPEYNYSVPGVLKNAIDWVSRPSHHFLVAFAAWTRRMSAVMVLMALMTMSACTRLRSPIAPVVGPPPTFIATTSDVRGTRLIDVREGTTKAAAFKAATDVLAKRYSVDVSDEHAGFLMTPWQASFMRDGAPDLRYRTRITIRFLGDEWKQVSVRAQANWQRVGANDEWDIGYDTQVLDDVSNDLAARIGKRP